MKIRYETLQRDQERMVKEMERALHKREAIAVRGRGQKSSNMTQANMTKKVSSLQNSVRKCQRDIGRYEIAIKEKMDNIEAVALDLEKCNSAYEQQEEQANNTQKMINDSLYDKQRYIDMTARTQRLAKRFDGLLNGKIATIEEKDIPKIRQEHETSVKNLNVVCKVITKLQSEHPHLQDVLSRVRLLASDV